MAFIKKACRGTGQWISSTLNDLAPWFAPLILTFQKTKTIWGPFCTQAMAVLFVFGTFIFALIRALWRLFKKALFLVLLILWYLFRFYAVPGAIMVAFFKCTVVHATMTMVPFVIGEFFAHLIPDVLTRIILFFYPNLIRLAVQKTKTSSKIPPFSEVLVELCDRILILLEFRVHVHFLISIWSLYVLKTFVEI
jgi:hypothetical protein